MWIINGILVLANVFIKNFRLQKTVVSADAPATIYASDSGSSVGIPAGSSTNRIFSIDASACSAALVGSQFTFFNLGTGRLTIQAPTGVSIGGSADAGTIYSDTDAVATLVIELVSATKFLVVGSTGTWTTT